MDNDIDEQSTMSVPRALYGLWFAEHPGVENPSDLNTQEKFDFAMNIGFINHRQMQTARKQGHEWTKWEYWKRGDS